MHIISGLATGGAEAMLLKLIGTANPKTHQHFVISLMDMGTIGKKLMRHCPVYCIDLKRNHPSPLAIAKLVFLVRRLQPDLIQGWMYHGNLAACLCGQILNKRYFWNIRASLSSRTSYPFLTRFIVNLNRRLSKRVECIIANSHQAIKEHKQAGFSKHNWLYLPNGFECANLEMKKVGERRTTFGKKLPSDAFIFLHAARYHPFKNHLGFVAAVSKLMKKDQRLFCIMAGNGVDSRNEELMSSLVRSGVRERFQLMGDVDNMSTLYEEVDYLILNSLWGEAFPNVLGEAMSFGVPCITTAVGDSAEIVGDCGWTCAVASPEELTQAMIEATELAPTDYIQLSARCQARVRERYEIKQVSEAYENAYESRLAEAPFASV